MTSRLDSIARVIPLVSAIVYVVLFVVSFFVLQPQFLWEPADIGDFFDGYGTVLFGAWMGGLAMVGLVWFLGSLAAALRAIGQRRLGLVAFGGGVAGAAATGMGFVLFSMGALRVDDAGGLDAIGSSASGIGPGYTVGIFDSAMILIFAAAPFMFGVTVAATAIGVARAGMAKPWQTAISVILALALWMPFISWIAVWVFLAWVLWSGWNIYSAIKAGAGAATTAVQGFASGPASSGPYGAGSHDVLPDGSTPEGYPVKGNVDSMLYHRPDSRSYRATGAEVWFDTAESAEAAGFARAKSHPED